MAPRNEVIFLPFWRVFFLSLCPSSNRGVSLSIALDIRLFLLILRPLSSKLLYARLPLGNLSEPSTKHSLRSMRI